LVSLIPFFLSSFSEPPQSDISDLDGKTALDYAIEIGNTEILEILTKQCEIVKSDVFLEKDNIFSKPGRPSFFEEKCAANENQMEADTRRMALYTQRKISQAFVNNLVTPTITIEIPPDGNCGFTATEYALRIDDNANLAVATTREGFINTVKRSILELQTLLSTNPRKEKLTQLIKAVYQDAGLDSNLAAKSLQIWENKFNRSSEWAHVVHFALMSYVYNIRFEFYVVDHVQNDRFIPRGGILGDGSVIDKDTSQEAIITVRLLHNSAGLVNVSALDPNNHFDLLYFDPDGALKTKIRGLGYRITQDNVIETSSNSYAQYQLG
jgi:hypothetical protein